MACKWRALSWWGSYLAPQVDRHAWQVAPGYNVAQFDAILHRIDLIAGQLAKVPTSSREVATVSSVLDLKVLPGGGG